MIQSLQAICKPRKLKFVFMQDFKKHNLCLSVWLICLVLTSDTSLVSAMIFSNHSKEKYPII